MAREDAAVRLDMWACIAELGPMVEFCSWSSSLLVELGWRHGHFYLLLVKLGWHPALIARLLEYPLQMPSSQFVYHLALR